jgi:hypothetical protein
MPPRHTKKPRNHLEPIVDTPTEQWSDAYAASDITNSKHGFINLPSELHLMILSNFPAIPEAEILLNPIYIDQTEGRPNYLDRFRVLLALSQTCHDLRIFYLPVCWERLQSCLLSGAKRQWYQDLGLGVRIQSRGLLEKSPFLLPLVK